MSERTETGRRDAVEVMGDVQRGETIDWTKRAEEHRQMARAAIRVALRHGIPDSEIMAEYENVQEIERV